MDSFNVEELKKIKINVNHNIVEGESSSSKTEYSITNPEEIAVHSKGANSGPLFNRADVKVNLYKDNEEDPVAPNKLQHPLRRSQSLKSIRAILEISDDERSRSTRGDTFGSYRETFPKRSLNVIRKLDEIVHKMKDFTQTAKKDLKMQTYKKDSDKLFKKYLDESHDLFEELRKNNSKKRSRTYSRYDYRKRHGRSSVKSLCSDSSSEDSTPVRGPSPKRSRPDTKYGHSSKYHDSDTSIHNKSSQSKKHSDSKKRTEKDFPNNSYYSISSIDSCSGNEIFEESSQSKNDRSYDRYSRSSRHSRRVPRYSERERNRRSYLEEAMTAKDIEERYYRYYAVMYAFTIIMDILRQDGIHSF